jgi:tetratricopeptide (TPR) repeat protein
MIDYTLWGMRPAGFIFTNIFLHAFNGSLFYFLLTKLSWRRLWAFTAALIFLTHPVQVESVAWISQRKTVLSLFFFLVAFYCYLLYRERKGKLHWGFYACSLGGFLLSSLAKATSVVFPLVLLVSDLCFSQKSDRRTWIFDKIPFVIIACATALITIKSQSPEIGGGTTSYYGGTPLATLFTMLPVFVRYLGLTLWPTNLSAVYSPLIRTGIDLEVALSALILLLVVSFGIFLFHRKRDLFFWFLLFFIGLLPVSQIVPFVTLMNDRYLYLPMMGASAFLANLLWLAANKSSEWKKLLGAMVIFVFAVFLFHSFISTIQRIPVWQNDHTLWQDAIHKGPNSPRAHYQYAHALESEGNINEAIREYEIGLELSPLPSERYFLARLYEKEGLLDKAEQQHLLALSQMPSFLDARNALALLYIRKGMIDQAIEQYRLALRDKPDWATGHNNIAVIYARKGILDKAVEHFELAAKFNPRDPEIHYNLGNAFLEKGLNRRAFEEFQKASTLDPANPLYNNKLADMLKMGNVRE